MRNTSLGAHRTAPQGPPAGTQDAESSRLRSGRQQRTCGCLVEKLHGLERTRLGRCQYTPAPKDDLVHLVVKRAYSVRRVPGDYVVEFLFISDEKRIERTNVKLLRLTQPRKPCESLLLRPVPLH